MMVKEKEAVKGGDMMVKEEEAMKGVVEEEEVKAAGRRVDCQGVLVGMGAAR